MRNVGVDNMTKPHEPLPGTLGVPPTSGTVASRHVPNMACGQGDKPPVDFPAGAIENGREFLRRLGEYDCHAGAIAMSVEYVEAVRCFEWLADACAQYANTLTPSREGGKLREAVAAVINEMSRQMPNTTEDWRATLTGALA